MAKWDKQTEKGLPTDFQTPPEVCDFMCGMIPANARVILEPTRGEGNLVHAIRKEDDKRFRGTDDEGFWLRSPDDFFQLDPEERFDAVVMNPPFSTKHAFGLPEGFDKLGMRTGYYFMDECMKRTNNVIALMPWFTITDSDVRMREMIAYGLKSITALPRKTFQYARIQTCIFEMERVYTGDTIFRAFEFKKK